MTDPIFVFNSNLAGDHSDGTARVARENHGAIMGQAEGLQASSYAIPTKGADLRALPLEQIEAHVDQFIDFAHQHPELTFKVSAIACGLGGYRFREIAPMFTHAPDNCLLPPEFLHELGRDRVETPWGMSDRVHQVAQGITFYETPSHGGFKLSPERMEAMPEHLRECSFTGNEFFEEDCSWSAVVLAFPDCFSDDDRA
ncbi:MAG TPA: hypothetical protein VFE62_01280, partial [Gemmataceae bacterium]|nr:hypothetical protein [Gemmataceae bacterium]